MRTEADQIQISVVRLAINENEVRLHGAVAMIAPSAGQQMIEIGARQWNIGREHFDNFGQITIEHLTALARFLAFAIALEAAGVPNRPH